MADDVRVTNFPEAGSKEKVAYDLMTYIIRSGDQRPEGKAVRGFVLDLYAECLEAAGGYSQRTWSRTS